VLLEEFPTLFPSLAVGHESENGTPAYPTIGKKRLVLA